MARSPALSPEEARRKAAGRFQRAKERDPDAQTAQEQRAKVPQAEVAKTTRLRALRLAKEAAEAEAEAAQRAADDKALATEARKRKTVRAVTQKSKSELV